MKSIKPKESYVRAVEVKISQESWGSNQAKEAKATYGGSNVLRVATRNPDSHTCKVYQVGTMAM